MASLKLKEADAFMKEGESLTTRSLFRWKPDWNAAATQFEKAAVAYKLGKDVAKAQAAYKRAATAFFNHDAVFLAAKSIESAAMLAKDAGQMKEAAELYAEAHQMYTAKGMNDKAADSLQKSAKLMEDVNSEAAVTLYNQVLEICLNSGREPFSFDAFKALTALLVRSERYTDAVAVINRHAAVHDKLGQQPQVFKLFLSAVVILLHTGNYQAADELYQNCLQVPSFLHTAESRAANELLDAFEHRDPETLKKVVSKQLFGFLEPVIARLARSLVIPVDLATGPTAKIETLNQATLDKLDAERRAREAEAGVLSAAADAAAVGLDRLVVDARPAAAQLAAPAKQVATAGFGRAGGAVSEQEAADRMALFSVPGSRRAVPTAAPSVQQPPEPKPEPDDVESGPLAPAEGAPEDLLPDLGEPGSAVGGRADDGAEPDFT